MKVITILISDGFAGAEHVAYNLLNNLKEDNILITNQEITKNFLGIEKLKVYNVGPFFTKNKLSWPIRVLSIRKRLKRIVEKEKPDIMHLILEWSFLMSSNLIRTKIPIIISLHGEETKKYIAKSSKVANYYLEEHFKNASKIISVGAQQIQNLPERYKKKTIVIPNGVDSKVFKPLKNIKQKNNVILFTGRFIDIKGIHEIINVAKQLPQYKFWFAGQGPLANLINLPNTKNLGFKTTEELVKLYNQATICIAPSYRESFGLVGLEAMSCQRAVIATSLGFSEYIENGKDGIIIPAKDEKALKEAIVKLLTNDKLRKTLEKNARKKALNYSWDKVAEQYLKVFEQTIKENKKFIIWRRVKF